MRQCTMLVLLLSCCLGLLAAPASAGAELVGGIHYLRTLGDIKDTEGFDENALGFLGGLDFDGPLLRLEALLEVIPDYAGSGELMIQPQGYAMLGSLFYLGAGIGVGHLGEFGWQDPFYALRGGVGLSLGGLGLDAFATYRFQSSEDLSGVDSDDLNSITFGVLVSFGG